VTQLGASTSEPAQQRGAIECVSHGFHRLIVRDLAIEHRERSGAVAACNHPNLVLTCLAANLLAPLVGVDALRRADLASAQQLGVVSSGALEKLGRDPAEALLVCGEHHPVAPGASVEPVGWASRQPRSALCTTLVLASLDSVVGLRKRLVEAFLDLFT
jgi:hypothetical protein